MFFVMASILPKILRRKKEEQKEKSRKEVKKERRGKERIEIRAEKATGRQKKVAEEAGTKTPGDSDIAFKILVRPRVTEKTTDLSKAGVYTFDVFARTNKILIKKAVEELYRVTVKKVSIANMPQKTRIVRGKRGARPGYKKAMVYLKEGDKIEFI